MQKESLAYIDDVVLVESWKLIDCLVNEGIASSGLRECADIHESRDVVRLNAALREDGDAAESWPFDDDYSDSMAMRCRHLAEWLEEQEGGDP